MDRSFWSQPIVIDASRGFVCARLATYEDAEEGKFLASVFSGRSGQLENTVFCIFASDGKKMLSRSGRSPSMVFRPSPGWETEMLALELHRIARENPAIEGPEGAAELPLIKNLRLAVNVAACDGQPLVVVIGSESWEDSLLQHLAWEKEFLGRFLWVHSTEKEIRQYGIDPGENRYLILAPNSFGVSATLLAAAGKKADEEELARMLHTGFSSYRAPVKSQRRHVGEGRRRGIHWQPEIPVADRRVPPSRRRGPPD